MARDENEEVCGAYTRHVEDEAVLGSGELVETLLPEEEPDTWAPPQQTVRRADTHRERLVVHPDWTLKAPPILDRSLIPSWGGPEALVHQRLPPHLKADVWYIDRRRGVLTRFHAVPRRRLYVPSQQGVPTGVAWTDLTGRRRTLAICAPTKNTFNFEDRFDVRTPKPGRNLEMPKEAESWTGRTEFELAATPPPVTVE